jgi:RNA polymerase sigma-70 factor, ECF subfamily
VSTPAPSTAEHRPRPEQTSGHGPLDRAAFDALFRACARDLHSYVFSLLGDRPSAEDVTALAFERLYRSRARLDSARGTPRSWLFAIARNAALDELRRRKRAPLSQLDKERPLDRERPQEPNPEQALEHVERRATVHRALQALPLREREIVLLKFHGQLSNSELARALGISESNAGTRLHRALERLRAECLQYDRQEVA